MRLFILVRTITACLAAGILFASIPGYAITITPPDSNTGLADTLFHNASGVHVLTTQFNSAAMTEGFPNGAYQAGTFISDWNLLYHNSSGTYQRSFNGIVLSTGNVSEYPIEGHDNKKTTTSYDIAAKKGQNDLLQPITKQQEHQDVVELGVDFTATTNTITFLAAFGSEAWPDTDPIYNDGFGLYVNDTNYALVPSSKAGPDSMGLPVNVDHPDMRSMVDTDSELNGILAPNGDPLLRFDVPVNTNKTNHLTLILGDATDSKLDSTVYLTALGTGTNEFAPLLPSSPPKNPQDGNVPVGPGTYDIPLMTTKKDETTRVSGSRRGKIKIVSLSHELSA